MCKIISFKNDPITSNALENNNVIKFDIQDILDKIEVLSLESKIEVINDIKRQLHKISPFNKEPVDCVIWVKSDSVKANDYNPNKVAPPEMKLLAHSIREDGYTQPIVAWEREDHNEVIDGFHRNRVGKEIQDINERIYGYLPVSLINLNRQDKADRIASTIRHNRARGKHQVDSMSDIILELKNRNWKNARIAKELGMEEDEILRLCQIKGLAEVFSDDEFSASWDIEKSDDIPFIALNEFDDFEEGEMARTVNTSDTNRIFHTYDKWECYKSGFYATSFEGKTKEECEQDYANFLSNDKLFRDALEHVIVEWKYSCEQYLTNIAMNRIAYLGQAAMCYATGIPACFRSGFSLLTEDQQNMANNTALEYLNKWLIKNGLKEVIMEEAQPNRQSVIY